MGLPVFGGFIKSKERERDPVLKAERERPCIKSKERERETLYKKQRERERETLYYIHSTPCPISLNKNPWSKFVR